MQVESINDAVDNAFKRYFMTLSSYCDVYKRRFIKYPRRGWRFYVFKCRYIE